MTGLLDPYVKLADVGDWQSIPDMDALPKHPKEKENKITENIIPAYKIQKAAADDDSTLKRDLSIMGGLTAAPLAGMIGAPKFDIKKDPYRNPEIISGSLEEISRLARPGDVLLNTSRGLGNSFFKVPQAMLNQTDFHHAEPVVGRIKGHGVALSTGAVSHWEEERRLAEKKFPGNEKAQKKWLANKFIRSIDSSYTVKNLFRGKNVVLLRARKPLSAAQAKQFSEEAIYKGFTPFGRKHALKAFLKDLFVPRVGEAKTTFCNEDICSSSPAQAYERATGRMAVPERPSQNVFPANFMSERSEYSPIMASTDHKPIFTGNRSRTALLARLGIGAATGATTVGLAHDPSQVAVPLGMAGSLYGARKILEKVEKHRGNQNPVLSAEKNLPGPLYSWAGGEGLLPKEIKKVRGRFFTRSLPLLAATGVGAYLGKEKLREKITGMQKKAKETKRHSIVPAVGVGAGLAGYALARRPNFVSATKYPVLRKMQESAGKKLYHTPYDEITHENYQALPWWNKALRRLKYGPEAPLMKGGKLPPEIMEEIRSGKASLYDYGRTRDPRKMHSSEWGEGGKGYTIPWGKTVLETKRTRTPGYKFEDKLFESQLLNKHVPGAMARTEALEAVMARRGLKLRLDGKNTVEDLRELQKALKEEYPQGFVVKERIGGASSSGRFPSEKGNWPELFQKWKKMRAEFLAAERKNPTLAAREYRKHTGYSGRVFEHIPYKNTIVQERIPIQKHPEGLAKKYDQSGFSPAKEYRIHVIGGKPLLSSARYFSKDIQSVKETFEAQKARKWLESDVLSKLPKKYHNIPFAFDVAPLEGGGYKIVEMNPTSYSGVLPLTPLSGQVLHHHMTGRWTPEASAAIGVGTGLLGAGGAAGAQKLIQPKEKKEPGLPELPASSIQAG